MTASVASGEFRFLAGLVAGIGGGAGSLGFWLRLPGGLTRPLPKSRGGGLLAGGGAPPLTLKSHPDPKILLRSDVWEALLVSSRLLG